MSSVLRKNLAKSALTGLFWSVGSTPFALVVFLLIESVISKDDVMNVMKVNIFTGIYAIVCVFMIGIKNFRHRCKMRRLEESGILNMR